MQQGEKKRLVICADDFGMNEAVNEGILSLAAQRRLSATTCLVHGPAFASGAHALAQTGIGVGLHLNFTESLGGPGMYLPVSGLILRSLLRRLDAKQLRRQIADQLDRYEDAFNQAPQLIDGHQHVHQFAQIRTVLISELERRYATAKPMLRSTVPGELNGTPLKHTLKARVIGSLGARRLVALARQKHYRTNRAFLGVYDFAGGQAAYAALLHAWLRNAVDGDMIMCHPASTALSDDDIGAQRYAEFRVLAGAQLGGWLKQYGVYW